MLSQRQMKEWIPAAVEHFRKVMPKNVCQNRIRFVLGGPGDTRRTLTNREQQSTYDSRHRCFYM